MNNVSLEQRLADLERKVINVQDLELQNQFLRKKQAATDIAKAILGSDKDSRTTIREYLREIRHRFTQSNSNLIKEAFDLALDKAKRSNSQEKNRIILKMAYKELVLFSPSNSEGISYYRSIARKFGMEDSQVFPQWQREFIKKKIENFNRLIAKSVDPEELYKKYSNSIIELICAILVQESDNTLAKDVQLTALPSFDPPIHCRSFFPRQLNVALNAFFGEKKSKEITQLVLLNNVNLWLGPIFKKHPNAAFYMDEMHIPSAITACQMLTSVKNEDLAAVSNEFFAKLVDFNAIALACLLAYPEINDASTPKLLEFVERFYRYVIFDKGDKDSFQRAFSTIALVIPSKSISLKNVLISILHKPMTTMSKQERVQFFITLFKNKPAAHYPDFLWALSHHKSKAKNCLSDIKEAVRETWKLERLDAESRDKFLSVSAVLRFIEHSDLHEPLPLWLICSRPITDFSASSFKNDLFFAKKRKVDTHTLLIICQKNLPNGLPNVVEMLQILHLEQLLSLYLARELMFILLRDTFSGQPDIGKLISCCSDFCRGLIEPLRKKLESKSFDAEKIQILIRFVIALDKEWILYKNRDPLFAKFLYLLMLLFTEHVNDSKYADHFEKIMSHKMTLEGVQELKAELHLEEADELSVLLDQLVMEEISIR